MSDQEEEKQGTGLFAKVLVVVGAFAAGFATFKGRVSAYLQSHLGSDSLDKLKNLPENFNVDSAKEAFRNSDANRTIVEGIDAAFQKATTGAAIDGKAPGIVDKIVEAAEAVRDKAEIKGVINDAKLAFKNLGGGDKGKVIAFTAVVTVAVGALIYGAARMFGGRKESHTEQLNREREQAAAAGHARG